MNNEYSLAQFKKLLQELKNSKYEFVTNPNVLRKGKSKIFLRHDIDVSLDRAFRLLDIERQMNIQGVYFFMVASPFYNICDQVSGNTLSKFLSVNTSIGLHASLGNTLDIDQSLITQKRILELIVQQKVSLMSFHQPKPEFITYECDHLDMFNMYSLFSSPEIDYFSDSNMNLDFNSLRKSILNKRNIQLLIHPVWWTESLKAPGLLWRKLVSERGRELIKVVQQTERSFDSYS